jgi:hypothetical protein
VFCRPDYLEVTMSTTQTSAEAVRKIPVAATIDRTFELAVHIEADCGRAEA